jgi:hypothetical protein
VLAYLFAKKDRDNIADDELAAFKALAKAYAALSDHQIGELLRNADFVEICRGDKQKV